MTPDQLRILQTSFDQLWPLNDEVADLFYDRLFVVAPHTRSLFPDDMQPQKAKFMGMLASAIGLLERKDVFESELADLGRRHSRYGVAAADYAPVGDALMWSLEHALGPRFTPEARTAWSVLYRTARDIMIDASNRDHPAH